MEHSKLFSWLIKLVFPTNLWHTNRQYHPIRPNKKMTLIIPTIELPLKELYQKVNKRVSEIMTFWLIEQQNNTFLEKEKLAREKQFKKEFPRNIFFPTQSPRWILNHPAFDTPAKKRAAMAYFNITGQK